MPSPPGTDHLVCRRQIGHVRGGGWGGGLVCACGWQHDDDAGYRSAVTADAALHVAWALHMETAEDGDPYSGI